MNERNPAAAAEYYSTYVGGEVCHVGESDGGALERALEHRVQRRLLLQRLLQLLHLHPRGGGQALLPHGVGPANGDSKGERDSHPAPAATCTRRKSGEAAVAGRRPSSPCPAAAAWSPIRLLLLDNSGDR
jgi:hypothetical protein